MDVSTLQNLPAIIAEANAPVHGRGQDDGSGSPATDIELAERLKIPFENVRAELEAVASEFADADAELIRETAARFS